MPQPADLKSNNQIIHRFIVIIFTTHACDEVQQTSLEYRKDYIQQIEILHYIDFVKIKDDLNTVVCYFTLALHPSDQHVLHYITIIKHFWKIKQFLTNVCDLIKYIMKYKRIWETEKLQLASSYTWQLMRLIQYFYLNVTVNHYWVFVITNNVDFGQMMRQKYVISNIYVEDTQLQLLCGVKKQCN